MSSSVSELFHAIEEKPNVEACRIGKQRNQNAFRPVRLTFASSDIVIQILIKARHLRRVESFMSVFRSPDRSRGQITANIKLVEDLIVEEPDRKNLIRNDKIVSADKSTRTK